MIFLLTVFLVAIQIMRVLLQFFLVVMCGVAFFFYCLFVQSCNTLTSIPLVLKVYLLFSFSHFYLAFIISPFLFNLA